MLGEDVRNLKKILRNIRMYKVLFEEISLLLLIMNILKRHRENYNWSVSAL